MMRIKVPAGILTADQLEATADIAEEYSKGIAHITTRQDIQLYWIPTKGVPGVMAKYAAVGLTTREACGNSVRNVTACPYAGVSPTELFDVTKHAEAITTHFLRNAASQKLPRKFKIALEGCPEDHARTAIHDVGLVAAVNSEGGKKTLGWKVYIGGGLGAAPMQAILLEPFTPAADMLRTVEAAVRIHDRLGDRKNKATARIKFVVKRLGADAFRQEVLAERAKLPQYTYPDIAATETDERPPKPTDVPAGVSVNGTFSRWKITNVLPQKQAGYAVVTIRLRLGDISSAQLRALAKIIRRYCGGKLRTAITQNLMLRWVRQQDLEALFSELQPVGLAETEAERLWDVTSCPGAETCQLGISASRGLARQLEIEMRKANLTGPDIEGIKIKVSGCPNSCGQHHVADIGFFGGARKVGSTWPRISGSCSAATPTKAWRCSPKRSPTCRPSGSRRPSCRSSRSTARTARRRTNRSAPSRRASAFRTGSRPWSRTPRSRPTSRPRTRTETGAPTPSSAWAAWARASARPDSCLTGASTRPASARFPPADSHVSRAGNQRAGVDEPNPPAPGLAHHATPLHQLQAQRVPMRARGLRDRMP
jgi:sulfite reductase beta subunit-like hemoprotein